MPVNYPTSLDTFGDVTTAQPLSAPDHIARTNIEGDAVEGLEAKVGIGASTPTSGTVLAGTGTGSSGWTGTPEINGPVGIGGAASNAKLEVIKGSSGSDQNAAVAKFYGVGGEGLWIAVDTTNHRGYIGEVREGTAHDHLILAPAGGNVGIGISGANPPMLLTVDGAVRNRQPGSTRYRSDWQVGAGAAALNAYDDTAAVYIPMSISASAIYLIGGLQRGSSVSGDLTGAGPFHDFAPTGVATCNRITLNPGSGNKVLDGISATGGGAYVGREILLVNTGGDNAARTITLKHAQGSSAGNQILTPGSADFVLPGWGCCLLSYYEGAYWTIVSKG